MKKKIILKNIYSTSFLSWKIYILLKNNIYIYISGPIGIGKTFFCSCFIKNFGFNGIVNSPSFNLVNEYYFKKFYIYHFDFYKINNVNDLIDIDLYNYFNNNDICLVEWPDNFISYLPKCDLYIIFYYKFNFRFIKIYSYTKIGNKILNLL